MKDALGHGSNPDNGFSTNEYLGHHVDLNSEDGLWHVSKGGGASLSSFALRTDAERFVRGQRYQEQQVNPRGTHSDGILNMRHAPAAGYYGRVSAKNGRAMGTYGPHETREAAAKEALDNHPRARTASTYRGHGMDIQWHNR